MMIDGRIILIAGAVPFVILALYIMYGISKRAKVEGMKSALKAKKAELDVALKKLEGMSGEIKSKMEKKS